MSALALGLKVTQMTSTGVHDSGLLDHKTILDKLADVLAGVGIANLIDFVRV